MNSTYLVFGILFILLGFLFFIGKLHVHLSAWKKMPEREKALIRIMPLCRNIGTVIMACGLVFLAGGIWPVFKDRFFIVAIIAWMAVCVADLVYIEKGKRYKIS